jgi:hypothetical protein
MRSFAQRAIKLTRKIPIDVAHIPAEIDDAATNGGNADEMVGKAAS